MDAYERDHTTDAASASPDFRIDVRSDDHATVVAPLGELDIATGPLLEDAIGALSGPVVVDLRGVTFIDVCGMRALLRADAWSRDRDGLRFLPGRAVRRMFEIAGVDDGLGYVE